MEPQYYEIRTRGGLGEEWSAWFDGLRVEGTAEGETVIAGLVADQSALHGLLLRIRNLGLPLLSVQWIEDRSKDKGIRE